MYIQSECTIGAYIANIYVSLICYLYSVTCILVLAANPRVQRGSVAGILVLAWQVAI